MKVFDSWQGGKGLLVWTVYVESIGERHARNRAGQIEQQILGGDDVGAHEAGNRCDAGHRHAGVDGRTGDNNARIDVPLRVIGSIPSA